MSRENKLINRSAVRKALKDACREWGHKRKNIPRDAVDQVEAGTRRLVTVIAAQGFKS
jgi:hypothetical protein